MDLEAAKKVGKPLSPTESLEKLKELLAGKTSVTFVIDAVDNCVNSPTYDYDHIKLLADLTSLVESLQCAGKILFSSQKYDTNIGTFLEEREELPKHYVCVDGQHDAYRDVRRFVRHRVEGWKKYEFLPTDKRNFEAAKRAVIEAVIDTAGQM